MEKKVSEGEEALARADQSRVEAERAKVRVVHLGRSSCHAIRGRVDESTRIPDGSVKVPNQLPLSQGGSGAVQGRAGGAVPGGGREEPRLRNQGPSGESKILGNENFHANAVLSVV